uniref:Protein smoothened n=1 Tax=Novocrania anomala TaxID=317945 RepID=A0A0U2MSC5_9BILA|nr:smoothened [Novocrania anomala]
MLNPKFSRSLLFVCVCVCVLLHTATCQGSLSSTAPPGVCTAPASCEPLQYSTCLGISLPYSHTSLLLANDSTNQTTVQEKLTLWSGLKNVPKCWEVIQPLLCAVYMPRCNGSTNEIDLPSKEMCDITRNPCRIVETSDYGWPDFLKCDEEHFRPECNKNPVSKLSFNTTSQCQPPLVKTINKESFYEGVEGCGLQCQNPLFTAEEHDSVHTFVAVVGAICLICTLFTMLTFIIDWKGANRYPSLILFFINASFFLGSIGWLAQFSPGARDDIVCRADGTLRMGEPKIGSGETASCTIVFVIVYFPMMASIVWFVILSYSWHLSFKALGTPRDAIEGKIAYFHLVAWCLPLVLTIGCLALSEIDGDSVSGICFVGYVNHWVRGVFVLLPVGLVIIIGLVFLVMGLITLINLRKDSPGVVSDKATAKIRETIFRIGIFAAIALIFVIVTFAVHLYIFSKETEWTEAFKEYAICQATSTLGGGTKKCELTIRPSIVAMEIHIFAYFGTGIAMSSWVWNKTSLDAWKKFFRKLLRMPDNKPVKLKKHRMIAQAFAKRHQMNNGRVSFSFCSTHDDPLGMKFDLNSVTSQDMSSAWMEAVPRLVRRRGGMIHPTAGTLRRYSDSDIQSLKSRRLSLESQSSMKQPIGNGNGKKKKKKKRGRRNRVAPVILQGSFDRRGSDGQDLPGMCSRNERRRASDTSILTHASAHNIRLSVEKLASSIESLHQILTGQGGRRPGTGIQVNAFHAQMFTASAFIPAAASLELEDLDHLDQEDTPLQQKDDVHHNGGLHRTYPMDAIVQIEDYDDDEDDDEEDSGASSS